MDLLCSSVVEYHVRSKDELVVSRSVIKGSFSVGVVISKLRTNGNELIGPPSDANGMLRIVGSKPSSASNLVLEVFVSHGEKGTRRKAEHCVVQYRPFGRVTIPYWKRTALERHLLCRMVDCIVHVHIPSLGGGINRVVKLVCPGSDDLLQVIVAELPVIKVIVSHVDRIPLIRRSPLDHRSAGYLPARIVLPNSDV